MIGIRYAKRTGLAPTPLSATIPCTHCISLDPLAIGGMESVDNRRTVDTITAG